MIGTARKARASISIFRSGPLPRSSPPAQKWYAAASGKPRFLWVHLYDCHAPYRPPAPFAEQYRDDPYLGEVAGVDAALQPLLAPFLEATAPPTLVVLTGDHGESLGEHGEDTHSLFAYEATLAVPLVLWYPGVVAPGHDGRLARHVDVAPTIAGVTGFPKLARWPGASLLAAPPKDPGAASYFEAFSATYNYAGAPLRGMIADRRKYIDLPLPELYDLKDDPSEKQNLFTTTTDEVRRLRRMIPAESALQAAAAQSKPDSEEVARLRSLGYLSGGAAVKSVYTVDDDPKRLVELNRESYRCVVLYQSGDLRGAIALARRVVEQRPDMALAYANLAFLLRRAGDTADALNVYRAAVARGVADDELLKHYGLALCEVGRAVEAVEVLRPLSNSVDPTKVNALGIALADAGRMARGAGGLPERPAPGSRERRGAWKTWGSCSCVRGIFPAPATGFARPWRSTSARRARGTASGSLRRAWATRGEPSTPGPGPWRSIRRCMTRSSTWA